ncbi:lysophospholipid acyltransferase family protein [Pseudenhygromyxa sp. WMMC2535]|uniref:1-acyl-sn-glycerol-3-phosphate acyltransferase n=1 Tax=Pseudenhygromyxa sp. WMMC2535 TaxID=2712867 RepID=UPI0015950466|nr:lysophospholipid acyltransferase family protein [Pseudenhygromyxa sp. WMMC2535]
MKRLKRFLGKGYLRLIGWRWEGERPEVPKYVLIAAPHTSNWDLFHMLAFAWVFDIPLSWMGKHTLFRGFGKRLFLALGGVPVDRRAPQGLVAQVAEEFSRRERMVLAVPPEGTRGYRDYWKSGFYYIALAAKVPILMGFLDFGNKRGGYGPLLWPTGDVKADMDQIRAFYGDKSGRYPELFGPVRLKVEDGLEDANARSLPLAAGE